MATTVTDSDGGELSEFTAGKAIAVPLAKIEKELAALWRRAAEAHGGHAVTRACLWNLIVHTTTDGGFARAKQVIDEISPALPARVLVLRTDRQKPPSLKAWIETNWHSAAGGARQIGSDEITLEAGGDSVDDLAMMVRALTVPDVPIAALWPDGAPSGRALDRELLAAGDRLVMGGESEAAVRAVAALVGDLGASDAEVIGLSWLRSRVWRQLLAALFDPPAPEGDVRAIDSVAITCAPDRAGGALLLAGWLASRLGWSEGRTLAPGRLSYRRDGGSVAIEITLTDGAPDPFAAVTLTTNTGSYGLSRDGATLIVNTPSVAHKQPLHIAEDREVWIAALTAPGRDPLFARALRHLAAP